MTKNTTTIHETLDKRIEDLPRLITILADDPDEWHDKRFCLPETSMVITMSHYLCDGLEDIHAKEALWQWCLHWSSFATLQAVLHGKLQRYHQETPRLRLIAYLGNLWLALEKNVDAELEEILEGIHAL